MYFAIQTGSKMEDDYSGFSAGNSNSFSNKSPFSFGNEGLSQKKRFRSASTEAKPAGRKQVCFDDIGRKKNAIKLEIVRWNRMSSNRRVCRRYSRSTSYAGYR